MFTSACYCLPKSADILFQQALATVLALWHSIALGRHTDTPISDFFTTLAAFGFAMLARMYRGKGAKKPEPVSKGGTT